jgi:NMD protein affecting ribosome stability and mRNA decay
MQSKELKPCPFCGCDKILTAEESWVDDDSVVVYCNNCGVSLSKSAWNNRPGEKQAVLDLVQRIRKVLDNDKDKRGYGHTFTELCNIESKIKQEAGDA